jgi:hypothetical protein
MARRPAPRRRAAETPQQKRYRVYQEKHPDWRSDPHWKQRARGHREREHVARAAREREAALTTGALTTAERGQIKKIAIRQAKRLGRDPVRLTADMRAWAQAHGYGAFKAYARQLHALERGKRVRERGPVVTIAGRAGREGEMEDFVDAYDLPDLDWLFYH